MLFRSSRKFRDVNQQFYQLSNRVYRKSDLASPLSEIMVSAIMMIILFLGGSMVLKGAGGMDGSIFITYIAIFSQLVPPVKQLTTSYYNVQKGLASADRINKILESETLFTDHESPLKLTSFISSIEFNNVSFAYTKGDEGYVLKNVSVKIPKGSTVALVGQSGSGKTTMADMIPRFYDPSEGCIRIDNTDRKSTRLNSSHSQQSRMPSSA